MESQISMFMVQSGPIRRSLVAFSTATLAEEDEAAIILSLSLNFKEKQQNRLQPKNKKRKKNQTLQSIFIKIAPRRLFGRVENYETLAQFMNETTKNNRKSLRLFSRIAQLSLFSQLKRGIP